MWVFLGVGFLGGCTQKNHRVFFGYVPRCLNPVDFACMYPLCVCYVIRKADLRELDKAAELAVIGHSVGAFVSTLDAPHLKHFATNVVRDVTSWLVKLFRY